MNLTPPCFTRPLNPRTTSCARYGKQPHPMMRCYLRISPNCSAPPLNASTATTVAPGCPALEAAAATSACEMLLPFSQRWRRQHNPSSLCKPPLQAAGIFWWWSTATRTMGPKSATWMMNFMMGPPPATGELQWTELCIGQYPMTFDGFQCTSA